MHKRMARRRVWFTCFLCCYLLTDLAPALAQARFLNTRSQVSQPNRQKAAQAAEPTDLLKQLNASLQTLVAKVSPAVVEIMVTGFGAVEDSSGKETALIARESKLGSGVIVTPDGYIMTNAHVISNAQSIEVAVTRAGKDIQGNGDERTNYAARLVGFHKETDLALLKIDASSLPFLPIDARHPIHQGQLVVALGNPEGLGNSVSMGVISAVDRQPDPKLPMVFIQTDAPINPGNSGGPLVDSDGYVVGINTFILSQSGGNEGLGFAIPARIVSFVYNRLRKFGHVDRSEIGAASEAITPTLAKGLNLAVTSGVLLVDVKPGGPAESAGLKIGDVVQSIDGKPIRSLPQLAASLYLHPTDEAMAMNVLRGQQKLSFTVPVLTQKHDVDQLIDMVDPDKNLVRKLGILALDIDDRIGAILPDLRIKSGVVVVANTAYSRAVDVGLRAGDVIHSVNMRPISSVADLQKTIGTFNTGAAVVLQVERADGMDFVAFEME
jgi:serine protease Do